MATYQAKKCFHLRFNENAIDKAIDKEVAVRTLGPCSKSTYLSRTTGKHLTHKDTSPEAYELGQQGINGDVYSTVIDVEESFTHPAAVGF